MPATSSSSSQHGPSLHAPADRVLERGADWRQQAACLSEDPELFFPIGTTGPAVRQAAEARAICRQCPALAPCLSWALQTGVEHGVWGAHTEEERRVLRRRRTGAMTGGRAFR